MKIKNFVHHNDKRFEALWDQTDTSKLSQFKVPKVEILSWDNSVSRLV